MASQLATTDNLPGAASSSSLSARLRRLFGATARKSVWGLADQAVVSGTNFLTTVIIGRFCGAGELGAYALGFTVLIMIAVVQESLIASPYTVFGNRLQGHARAALAGSMLMHYVILALLMAAVLGIASIFMPALLVLVVVAPFTLLRDLARRMALAHLHVRRALLIDVVVATLQLGALIGLALTGRLKMLTAFLVIAGACAAAGLMWLVLTRRDFVVQRSHVRREMARSWTFGRWVFASQTTRVLDSYGIYWLIAAMMGATSTGQFAACMTMVFLANPILLGVANIFEPRAANAFAEEGPGELSRVTWKVCGLLVLAMGALALGLTLFGDTAMVLLYGADYAGHQRLITLMALCMLLDAAGMPCADALRVLERPLFNFHAAVAGLVITIAACVVLIPSFGLDGAAFASLAAGCARVTWRVVAFRIEIAKALDRQDL